MWNMFLCTLPTWEQAIGFSWICVTCGQRCIKSCDVLKSKAGNFLLTDKEDSERSPSGPESFLRGPRTPVGGWGDNTRTTSSSYLLECCTFEGKWEKNGKDHIVIWTNWVLLEIVIILTLFVWKRYIYLQSTHGFLVSLFVYAMKGNLHNTRWAF